MKAHDAGGGKISSSSPSLTSALVGSRWLSSLGRVKPRKQTRHPFCSRLDGHQGRSGRVRKISPGSGLDPLPKRQQRVAIRTTLSRPTIMLVIISSVRSSFAPKHSVFTVRAQRKALFDLSSSSSSSLQS